MMETEIKNQVEFDFRIKYFKDKDIEDFKIRIAEPGDKNFIRTNFERNVLDLKLNSFYTKEHFTEARNFRNSKLWLNGIKTFEAIAIFCLEKKLKDKFQFILQSLAEHDAILNVYDELNLVIKENQNQIGNRQAQNVYGELNSDGKDNQNTNEKNKAQFDKKLTIKAFALMHVYLVMYGGQPVTQQNKNKLAKKYNFKSGDKLRNEFTNFQNDDKRININATNKRAANEHLQRFKNILSLLEIENSQAYHKAKEDLNSLEIMYNKYY